MSSQDNSRALGYARLTAGRAYLIPHG